jgi:hypothetical protein
VSGTSFPASPVEKQLFYRTDLHKLYIYNGTGWVDTTLGTDFITHASRHQHEGADEISVAGLSGELADRQKSKCGDSTLGWTSGKLLKGAGANVAPTEIYPVFIDRANYLFAFESLDNWTQAFGGSGSLTWGLQATRIQTGTTANSYARLYIGTLPNVQPASSEQVIYFQFQNLENTLNKPSTHEARICILAAYSSIPPTDTSNHIGVRITNGDVYVTNGNGTNSTVTDSGIDIDVDWKLLRVLIVYTSTSIKFFITSGGGDVTTLVATHTTNIGNLNNNGVVYFHITNPASAANRGLSLSQVNFIRP